MLNKSRISGASGKSSESSGGSPVAVGFGPGMGASIMFAVSCGNGDIWKKRDANLDDGCDDVTDEWAGSGARCGARCEAGRCCPFDDVGGERRRCCCGCWCCCVAAAGGVSSGLLGAGSRFAALTGVNPLAGRGAGTDGWCTGVGDGCGFAGGDEDGRLCRALGFACAPFCAVQLSVRAESAQPCPHSPRYELLWIFVTALCV